MLSAILWSMAFCAVFFLGVHIGWNMKENDQVSNRARTPTPRMPQSEILMVVRDQMMNGAYDAAIARAIQRNNERKG